jgi:thiol-disulfide isomerase/thioredoxin
MQRPTITTIAVLTTLTAVLLVAAWYTYQSVENRQLERSDVGQAFFGDSVAKSEVEGQSPYTAVNGANISLQDYFGSILFVNAWASWSPLSRDELIALNTVAGEYKDKGIIFLAVNRKETSAQAERFLATLPPLPNLVLVIDTHDHFYGHADGYAMPESLIYDENGKLLRHERTVQTADTIRQLVNEALAAE